MDLVLIRHPAPAIDAGVCYGKTDVPLAGDAAESARALARRLAALDAPLPAYLATSPLQRCAGVARWLAEHFGCACGVDARLREIDFGDWEGQRWDAIDRAALDAWAADLRHARTHGGESVAQFEARVVAWFDLWRAPLASPSPSPASSVFAVTHAGVMRMIASLALDEPLETTLTWPLDMAAVVWLRREANADADGWRLLHWNA
ncbi:histidine phosphatase family protein [Trinickia acidisoli]|uniref:histidine phosphatase family protein n=1 Tax=Trinickia acidisoli TaxID=2767482 RepID=UPI001A8D00E3|nr:histidine phosphatase family protein [Trinickia acidisoli]